MKGSILDFSIQHNTGFISGDDNQRYSFNGADWRSERPPSRGDRVDFIVNTTGEASEIYLALGSSIYLGEKNFQSARQIFQSGSSRGKLQQH